MLTTPAYAKLNLSLEILGRRPDGFHDLISVMQTVSLADTLTVSLADSMQFDCTVPELGSPTNLAYRAARLVRESYRVQASSRISLHKEIPAAAGLGGGSSDAAAALIATAYLWSVPTTCESLQPLAALLGSDVPFFLTGGTALVEGRGERVTPLPLVHETWYLLVKPPIEVATRDVFGALSDRDWNDGATTQALAKSLARGGQVTIGINTLEQPLFRLYPEAWDCFNVVQALFPRRTMISGSGPTVFAICEGAGEACAGAEKLAERYWTRVTRSCMAPSGDTPCR